MLHSYKAISKSVRLKRLCRTFSTFSEQYDVAVVGGGISGASVAARLQAQGLSTAILESHRILGGCAGYFEKSGFSFDVGATTFVDFEKGGVGGEFLESIGMTCPLEKSEVIPGYKFHLPKNENGSHDVIRLFRHAPSFTQECLDVFGNSPNIQEFWRIMNHLSLVFWEASRKGIKMPLQSISDIIEACSLLPAQHWHLGRYLFWTMGDLLHKLNLWNNLPLVALMRCLVEDTIHCNDLNKAPLINAALGISIRSAGLTRPKGGAKGFWNAFHKRYEEIGGKLHLKTLVTSIEGGLESGYRLVTNKGDFFAKKIVSSLPLEKTIKLIHQHPLVSRLTPYIDDNKHKLGGGIVIFLGIPQEEVVEEELQDIKKTGFAFTHHQILQKHELPLGSGNNMFISVSSPNDLDSAPENHRAVMISTHCEVKPWFEIKSAQEYVEKKNEIGNKLLDYARRVYPKLGTTAKIVEIGTPRTYMKFTKRPFGAVGGYRLDMKNSNQWSAPQNIGKKWGIWCVGDTTWPGLGTVACILGSRIAAKDIHSTFKRTYSTSAFPSFSSALKLSATHLTDFAKRPEDVHKLLLKYANNNKNPFVPIAFNPFDTMLLVSDANISHQILSGPAFKNRTSFPIIDYTYTRFMNKNVSIVNPIEINMGGVTFTNGEDWKRNRSIGLRLMGNKDFLLGSICTIIQCTDELIDQWKKSNGPINVGQGVGLVAIEILKGHLIFGTKLGAINPDSSDSFSHSEVQPNDLVHCTRDMLNTIQDYIYVPLPANFFKVAKTPGIRRLDSSVDKLKLLGDKLMARFVAKDKSLPEANLIKNQSDRCLGNTLATKYPELTREDMQALLMDLLGAGHDTTANLIVFTIGSLLPENIKKEQWYNDLMKEIEEFSENFPNITPEVSEKVMYHVEYKMPMLHAIIKESMRLYPLGAAFSRVPIQDVELNGYKLPQGSKLLVSPYVLQNMERYWGKTVNEFNPNRFITKDYQKGAWIPLGGGSRGCLGGVFGLLEAKLVVIRILQRCKLTKAENSEHLDSILAFTLRPKHPVLANLN